LESAQKSLSRLERRLKGAGSSFAPFGDEVASLQAGISKTADLEGLDAKLSAIESRVFDVVSVQLPESRRRAIAARVADNAEFLSQHLSAAELEPLSAAQLRDYTLQEVDLAGFTWE
jgi:peroxiredoxin